jgi:RNA polymerase sigma-70 factor, ECF subfamily
MTQREELENRKDWQMELYQRYHQKVFGICLYFLKDREEAKDASHDVFLKVFRSWGEFEWKCDPMTWIGAIAKHDCFSRLQKHKKRQDRREQYMHEEEIRSAPETEPEDLVLHRMRLEKCLPLIRGKLREILRLNLEQGLNHREIAVRMGVSRVAITRRLTRFKKTLLAALPAATAAKTAVLPAGMQVEPPALRNAPARALRPQVRLIEGEETSLQETGIRLRAA